MVCICDFLFVFRLFILNTFAMFLYTHERAEAFPDSSVGKESACNAGDPGSLGREYLLEKGLTTHSSILAQRMPWTVCPWGGRESDTTGQFFFNLLAIFYCYLDCSQWTWLQCSFTNMRSNFSFINIWTEKKYTMVEWVWILLPGCKSQILTC